MLTPEKVSDDEFLFGVKGDRIESFIPNPVPEEFKSPLNKWNKLFNAWFFYGLTAPVFKAKEGVLHAAAIRHIGAVMGSDLIPHETKEAACAYLLAEWYDAVVSDNYPPVVA